ncbi:hypothetical protein KFU94_05995 [Chloroflexi bacterium TSY]|nr:hypothetical protein [Chloroflexi bacterium TSY]
MLTAPEITIAVLMNVLQVTPVGTNVNVMRLMWAMMNGSFLKSRGAIHSGLSESGLKMRSSGEAGGAFDMDHGILQACSHRGKKKWSGKGMGGKKLEGTE